MKWLVVSALAGGLFSACSPGVSDKDSPNGPGLIDAGLFGGDVFSLPDAPTTAGLVVDTLDPPNGPYAGGTQVIVHGNGFVNGMTISVGGRAVDPTDLDILDAHRASIVTPPGAPGLADVVVVAGTVTATRTGGFTYEAIYANPVSGAVAGGTFVTVRGFDTSFQDGDVVMIGGLPLMTPTIVNGTEISGYTPPGTPGDVDVVVISGGVTYTAKNGYTYEDTTNAVYGGTSGGPINGSISVVIIDAYSDNGVPGMVVSIGDPATASVLGTTDAFGQVTLSAPGLHGPVDLIVGGPKYEQGAFFNFDAQNVTMFLTRLPDPNDPPPTGPFPPGRANAQVDGDVVFGGITGIGTTSDWSLVPAPRTPTEIKRTYVFATAVDIFSGTADPGAGGTVDYVDGQTSWHYSIPVRSSAFALVAIAGLYDPAIDPDATPPGQFTPFAMGVARNMLAGPGQMISDVPIVIDIPLDTTIMVQLDHPPTLNVAGTLGPTEFHVNALIDLGGEGVIVLPGSHTVFSDQTPTVLDGMAPLANEISDASYAFVVGAYTGNSSYPMSERIVRGSRDLGAPIVIGDFLAVPRLVDPGEMGGTVGARHIQMSLEAGPTGRTTLIEHRLFNEEGIPLYRVFAAGDQLDIPWYDMTRIGVPELPFSGLTLYSYFIAIPGGTFNDFNYGQLNENLWSAYTLNVWEVSFPEH